MVSIRIRRGIAVLGLVAIAVPLVALHATVPARATALAPAVSSPRHARDVRELITVRAAAYHSTYATLRAYRVFGKRRVLVFGPWTARVGYNGIAPPGRKREGDGRTPSGSYGFSFFFGVWRDLGFSFPFRHAYRYDVWDDDPSSPRYNEWVNERRHNPGADPEPMHNLPAYEYAAVIAYNTARVPGLGSAVFLHVGTGTATGGCVSLPRLRLIRVLHWLRPGDHPVIRISAR